MSGVFFFPGTASSPGQTIQAVCEPAAEAVKPEEAEAALQTVDLSEAERTPEPAEEPPQRGGRTASRRSLLALLRQTVSSACGPGGGKAHASFWGPGAQGRRLARALGSVDGISAECQLRRENSLSSCGVSHRECLFIAHSP